MSHKESLLFEAVDATKLERSKQNLQGRIWIKTKTKKIHERQQATAYRKREWELRGRERERNARKKGECWTQRRNRAKKDGCHKKNAKHNDAENEILMMDGHKSKKEEDEDNRGAGKE